MKTTFRKFFTALAVIAGSVSALQAQTQQYFTYTDGNLILGFQATSGQGTSQNVFFNLGKATDFRDNGSRGTLGNIGTTLSNTYGADWYTRTDLWFGVIGNLNAQPTSGIGSRSPVDGDPSRTFYLSRPATAPGLALLIPAGTYAPDPLGSAGNALRGLEQVLTPTSDGTGWNLTSSIAAERGIFRESDGAGVLSLAIAEHATAWNNSWSKWNPTPGAAFSIFTGGIQQNFGKGGAATYVDVQRVLATNTGASPTGVVGGGTYETTISISPGGVISAVATSTSTSAFTTWVDSFNPPLTAAADRALSADPDRDGIPNLLEFVLNGNPGVPNSGILPVLDSSGANFVFSLTRRVDSATDVQQVFEYSTDLVDWSTNAPITLPSAVGSSGFVTVAAATGTAPNQVQQVTISIPKGSAPRLFGRLKAVK